MPPTQLVALDLEVSLYQLYRDFFDRAERKRRWSLTDDIFVDRFPAELRDRAPRLYQDERGNYQWDADGKSVLAETQLKLFSGFERLPGAVSLPPRLKDLDAEGIWGEVLYQSIGLWSALIEDRQLIRDAARAENAWLASEIQSASPDRLVCAALMPMLDVDDAVAELQHAAGIGLHLVSLPTGNPPGMKDWHDDSWEPLWAAAEEGLPVIVLRPVSVYRRR